MTALTTAHMPLIRPSRDADVAAITALYAHHVLHGTGTFETEPPTEADVAQRRRDEPGRALQVGAGAGLNWQVLNQTQLQVEVGTAPGQNRTQVSVMLQLQL